MTRSADLASGTKIDSQSRMKNSFLKILAKIFATSFLVSTAFAGEFSGKSDNLTSCSSYYYFTGTIAIGDARTLANIVERQVKANESNVLCTFKSTVTIKLLLDSSGGDVGEALRLGRVLRKHEVSVGVAQNKKCLSACVYLIAGAVDRDLFGQVGIHRPYLSHLSSVESSNQIKQRIDSVELQVVEYLKEMNVSPELFYVSQSIEPEKMKVLTNSDLERFRLNGEDVVYNERKTKRNADLYGISMAEYRRRHVQSSTACNQSSENFDSLCYTRVLLGVSNDELNRRIKKMHAGCPNIKNGREFEACFKKFVASVD